MCMIWLNLALALTCLLSARFGPFRGSPIDLYPHMSRALTAGIEVSLFSAFLGFILIWLPSPELRHRYRWLSLLVFLLFFAAAAQPG